MFQNRERELVNEMFAAEGIDAEQVSERLRAQMAHDIERAKRSLQEVIQRAEQALSDLDGGPQQMWRVLQTSTTGSMIAGNIAHDANTANDALSAVLATYRACAVMAQDA